MKRFKRLVVLDNILLPDKAWDFLRQCADNLDLYGDDPVHGRHSEPSPFDSNVSKETSVHTLGALCTLSLEYTDEQKKELGKRIADADAIISCWTNLPDELLLKAPKLKYVLFWTNAFAHRINSEYCKKKGIHVDHIPDYGTFSVSEYVFAAILQLYRNLSGLQRDNLRGSWNYEYLKTGKVKPDFNKIGFSTLQGKSIGIIGMGRIGSRVAITARLGFGMNTYYFSRTRKRELEGLGIEYQDLDDLIQEKDIVSLHLPPETRTPVLDSNSLCMLRKGTTLINTSSGMAIDESKALDLAEDGHIRLVMDVYERIPPRKRLKSLIQKQPGMHLFTYRAGWYTKESIGLKAEILMEKIASYLEHI